MNKKNILGMNMLEWKSLAGLQDPYALELAQLSAEVGVPDVVQSGELIEARRKPSTPAEQRLAMMKHVHRSRRSGKSPDPEKVKKYDTAMQALKAKSSMGEDVTVEEVWDALLMDHGLTVRQFNALLDEAMETGDAQLADELLALEDRLDELAGVLGAMASGAGKAVRGAKDLALKGGKAVKDVVVRSGKAVGASIKKGYEAGQGVAKAAGDVAAAPGATGPDTTPGNAAAPGAVKPGASVPGAPAAGNGGAANPASAAVPAATPTADPQSAAPKTPGESPAAAKAPAPGAGTGQPGAGAQKKPGLLKNLATGIKGVAKVVGGSAGIVTNTAVGGLKGVGKVAKGVKAGVKEDFEDFGGWLEQRGVTLEEYSALIDYAMETGDVEEMDSLLALEDLYNEGLRDLLGLRPKKTTLASPEQYAKARAVVAKHGVKAVRAANVKGKDVEKKPSDWRKGGGTSVNSAVEHFYHLVGRPITEG